MKIRATETRNRSGPPTHGGNEGVTYFVDDIALERLPEDLAALERTTGVCTFDDAELTESLPSGTAGANVYFASNEAVLDTAARRILDDYAALLAPYRPVVFTVYGFADRRTGDNQALSDQRIAAVLDYLKTTHKLQSFQFLARGFGDSRSHSTDLQDDRRVELLLEPTLRAEIPYRYALQQVWAGRYDEALRALRMWSVTVLNEKAPLIKFDPRMEALRRTPGYATFVKTHDQRYRRFGKPAFARTLDSLFLEDQRYRTLAPRVENLNAWYADLDSTEATVGRPSSSPTKRPGWRTMPSRRLSPKRGSPSTAGPRPPRWACAARRPSPTPSSTARTRPRCAPRSPCSRRPAARARRGG